MRIFKGAKALDLNHVAQRKAYLGGITSRVREKAVSLSEFDEGLVVDVCCGNALLFAAVGNAPSIRVGVDRSGPILREGRNILAANHVKGVCLVQADAHRLPFRPRCADHVCLLNTLMNVPTILEVELLMEELMLLCRVGGRLTVELRNGGNFYLRIRYLLHSLKGVFPTRVYRLEWVRRLLEGRGFRIVKVVPVGLPFRFAALSYLIEAECIE